MALLPKLILNSKLIVVIKLLSYLSLSKFQKAKFDIVLAFSVLTFSFKGHFMALLNGPCVGTCVSVGKVKQGLFLRSNGAE